MPNYVRAIVPGGTFFFTVTLLDRRESLLTEHVELLRSSFASVRKQYPFRVDAIVVMPEHLHCIWTLPPNDADFSTRWRLIKSRFACALPTMANEAKRRVDNGERGIWQRRFWEHAISSDRDLQQHIDYLHFNPVKHGQVSRVSEWPHSSFHRFVAHGQYPIDWGASETVQIMELA